MNYTDREIQFVTLILACEHPEPFKVDPVFGETRICSMCGATKELIAELERLQKRLQTEPEEIPFVSWEAVESPRTHAFKYNLPPGYFVEELPLRRVALDWKLYFRGVVIHGPDGEPFRPSFPNSVDFSANYQVQMQIVAVERSKKIDLAIETHRAKVGDVKTGQFRTDMERMGLFGQISNEQLSVIKAWVKSHRGETYKFTFSEGGPIFGDTGEAHRLIEYLKTIYDEGWQISLIIAFEDMDYLIGSNHDDGYHIDPPRGHP